MTICHCRDYVPSLLGRVCDAATLADLVGRTIDACCDDVEISLSSGCSAAFGTLNVYLYVP